MVSPATMSELINSLSSTCNLITLVERSVFALKLFVEFLTKPICLYRLFTTVMEGCDVFPVTVQVHFPVLADTLIFGYVIVYVQPFGEAFNSPSTTALKAYSSHLAEW